ncbi:hypothetical protein [Frigidibacter sp. MR17.24]|uniref:hypothetical protein n=1 Tax=Frigidibacter sp. MR17.24 TaxID=3127345 RepID=UPI003012A246
MKLDILILSGALVAATGGAAFANGGEDANDWGPSKPRMFRDTDGTSLSQPATRNATDAQVLRVVDKDGNVIGYVEQPKK